MIRDWCCLALTRSFNDSFRSFQVPHNGLRAKKWKNIFNWEQKSTMGNNKVEVDKFEFMFLCLSAGFLLKAFEHVCMHTHLYVCLDF